MKLAETVDDEKGNTCNGNGIADESTIKKTPDTNGDNQDESESDTLDLLVIRNDDETNFQNGTVADDSISLSSNSSNNLLTMEENDLSDEDFISLRISEEEDQCESSKTETEATYFTTSPLPSADDKTTEANTPASLSTSEGIDTKITKSINCLIKTTNESSEIKDGVTSDNLTINSDIDIATVSELNDGKILDVSSEKEDDNIESLLLDIKQSETKLKSENKNITISDLSKEIEDIINDDKNVNNTKDDGEAKVDKVDNLNIDLNENSKCKDDSDLEKNVVASNIDLPEKNDKIVVESKIPEEAKISEKSKTIDESKINDESKTNDELKTSDKSKISDESNTSNKSNTFDESGLINELKTTDKIDIEKSESAMVITDSPSDSETNDSPLFKIDITETLNKKESEIEIAHCATLQENQNQETNNQAANKDHDLESMDIDLVDVEKKEKKVKDENDDKNIETDDRNSIKIDIQQTGLEEIKDEDDKSQEKPSLKRTLDKTEDAQDTKKLKINGVKYLEDSKTEYVRLTCLRDFMSKKEINSLTRAELEEFCIQKICEVITQTSKIGELNRKVTQQEAIIESFRNKYSAMSKQIRDLEVVHTRVIQEVRSKAKDGISEITPVKITRSVGLQVSLQALGQRMRVPVLPCPQELQTQSLTGIKRKIHRNSLPSKIANNTPPSPISLMPPPSKPPIKTPPSKGIKTILPKVYSATTEQKDNSSPSSLLGNYLQQQPSTSKTAPVSSVRKSAPGSSNTSPVPSTSINTDTNTKVIDLTDEDDTQKTTSSGSGASTSGNIRVMAPQQLNNAQTVPVTSTSIPRVTYLVQGGQQGQQVLLATSTAPTGQVRPTLMFKPLTAGQVSPGQRVNITRPNSITVLPSTSTANIRPGQIRFTSPVQGTRAQIRNSGPPRHPAPLPGPPAVQPSQPSWKGMPPKPTLKISRVGDGIVLSWRMQTNKDMSVYEEIASYQLYAYQETNAAPSTDMWRKVGDVKALALPMACTLTQFTDGNRYHFAVRAVDVKSRVGPFSQPEKIALP